MTARRLVLLRHGRTEWNALGRAQGVADIGLDERGRTQAAAAARRLARLRPVALWTSDLSRAQETCGFLESATGLRAEPDRRLREVDVGQRQGMDAAGFAAAFPQAYASWRRGDGAVPVPGAETDDELVRRVVPALREHLATLAPGETGVVVGHGYAIRQAVVVLLGWPHDNRLRGLDNGAWATLAEPADGPDADGAEQVRRPLRLTAWNQCPDEVWPGDEHR